MDRLALIGVSHRRGGARALEAWQAEYGSGPELTLERLGLRDYVTLATCNRFEIVAGLPEGASAEELRSRLTPRSAPRRPYLFAGDAALEQLARIAASLDSLNPGEDQIQRQVREAYARARERGSAGPVTSLAFDTALRIAKRVRSEVPLAPVNTSLFSLALPTLRDTLAPGDTAVVVGAGEMATLAAKGLASLPAVRVLIVNRDPQRGARLAASVGADSMPLADFLAAPPPAKALVTATPVALLLRRELLRRVGGLRLVLDLGLPRNAERLEDPAVLHFDMDALQVLGDERRERLAQRLAQAESLVQGLVDESLREWAERQLAPSIRKLRELYLQTIGDALPAEEARRLAHRFAHVPLKGLRALVREHGYEAARTYLDETGLLE